MNYAPYRLARDVENPHPDRRQISWVCKPIWKAGTLVLRDPGSFSIQVGGRRYTLELPQMEALEPALEPVEPSFTTVLADSPWDYNCDSLGELFEILRSLCDSAPLTPSLLSQAIDKWLEAEDPEA